MKDSKKRLALLWFTGAGILFLIMLIQTFMNHYGPDVNEAWGWLLTNIMPTLSLIIGVLVSDAMGKGVKVQSIDAFLFKLTYGLSLLYLSSVLLHILFQPISPTEPLEMMRLSNLWLGPFQGLVSASLGAFFIASEKK